MNLKTLFAGAAHAQSPRSEISPAEARERQSTGAILIDVREPDEWRAGHAPNARHIPLNQLSQHLAKLPTDKDILFVCQSGARSGMATSAAHRARLAKARNVRGGMLKWVQAGLPLSK